VAWRVCRTPHAPDDPGAFPPEAQVAVLALASSTTQEHHNPDSSWSLDELARESGTSRAVLAERFVHYVGMPPMQYLARWRMQLASAQLTSSDKKLAQIAGEVGYGSEAAFSRAFKREVGMAPADFRRAAREEQA